MSSVFSRTSRIGPEVSVAGARPVGICLAGRTSDLCVTNNQEIISCYSNVAADGSPCERAWDQGILLIVPSLPVLPMSDDLKGLTCS